MKRSPYFRMTLQKYLSETKAEYRTTPFGNTLTIDFAKAAIAGNNLGREHPQIFLTINCASTDYVGHQYWPIIR